MGPGSDPGTGSSMGGLRVSATRKSHRRNYSVPNPQVSFTRYSSDLPFNYSRLIC
jgi:hypothetical protein